MSDNITKIMTISEKTIKEYPENTDYQFKDQDGMVFHVYKFKKGTQTESAAHKQMNDMGIKVGSTVEAWYAEVPNKHGSNTRYIASFKEANEQPVKGQQPAPRPQAKEPTYHKEEDKSEEFWEKKAYKQCLWNAWLEQTKTTLSLSNKDLADRVWSVFNFINADADKRFAHGMEKARLALAPTDEPLPEETGDIDVSGIPF